METTLDIAKLIALLSVSALCVYLIVVLARLKDVFIALQQSISDFTVHAKPVLENLEFITEKFRSISAKVDDQVNLLHGSLESIKSAADNVVLFEQRVQQWLEEPIFRITSAFSGIVNGIVGWMEGMRRDRTR